MPQRVSSKERAPLFSQSSVCGQEQLGGTSFSTAHGLLVGDRTACCVLLCVESPTGKDAALPGVGLPCRPTIVGALIGWESGMTAFLCECSSLCSQALGESKASMPWC